MCIFYRNKIYARKQTICYTQKEKTKTPTAGNRDPYKTNATNMWNMLERITPFCFFFCFCCQVKSDCGCVHGCGFIVECTLESMLPLCRALATATPKQKQQNNRQKKTLEIRTMVSIPICVYVCVQSVCVRARCLHWLLWDSSCSCTLLLSVLPRLFICCPLYLVWQTIPRGHSSHCEGLRERNCCCDALLSIIKVNSGLQ